MDRQPRLPIGGTAGTGNFDVLVGHGAMHTRKTCRQCGTKFSVPSDAFAKEAMPLMQAGREVPVIWYAQTKQTKLNGISEYKTKYAMTRMDAACYFDNLLSHKNSITGKLDNTLNLVTRMFRKVPLTDPEAFSLCRTCYRDNRAAKAESWHEESVIVRDKKGKVKAVLKPNHGKELPEKFAGVKLPVSKPALPVESEVKGTKRKTVKLVEQPVMWRCSTPSTRREASMSVQVPRPMLLKEAREYFRNILSRESLNGCSVYW
jgi:hypothetical protein